MPSGTRSLLGACLVAALSFPVGALAQTAAPTAEQMETRRTLLTRARDAIGAGRHEEALDLINQAGDISMNSSLRRAQAQELVALERFPEAYMRASDCVLVSEREPASAMRDQVVESCRGTQTQIQRRVGRLELRVASPPENFEVRVAGNTVDSAHWAAYAVAPGPVVIEASAPHYRPFRRNITLRAGGLETVEIALEAEPAAEPTPAQTQAQPAPAATETTPAGPTVVRSPIGPIVAGVGVVALGIGIALNVVAGGQYSSLQRACQAGTTPCTSYDEALRAKSSIESMDGAGIGLMVGGGVLAAAGVVMFFALSHTEEAPPSTARVRVVPGIGGVSLVGEF